ncbi:MAG TPA: hypothetical protein VFI17_08020 [Solirubrobacterales bacterium]|nr:hypothetical protein [Solirubrobacterales bacterium]
MNDEPTPINARPKRKPPEALEDLSLALREHVIWPVGDWVLGLSDRGRLLAAGGAVAAVIALGVGAASLGSSGGSGAATPASPVAAAPKTDSASPAPQPKPEPEPTLHGAAPVFKPPTEKPKPSDPGSQEVDAAAAKATADNTGSAATDTISSTPTANAARVSTSKADAATVDGPPAGPEAIAVAREFAKTFVVYEIGGDKTEIRKGFAVTTTPALRRALLRRPPRQPAGIEVPKAKVLNVVPAPSHGSIYPVSVSLLRVGVTSELRLEMEELKNKQWRVINVLG